MRHPRLQEILESTAPRCIATDDQLARLVEEAPSARVQTVNLHHLSLCQSSSEFAHVTSQAEWITADGWPVARVIRLFKADVQRVTGSALIERVTNTRLLSGRRIGLIGTTSNVGDSWSTLLEPSGCRLVYREHGQYEDWEPSVLAHEAVDSGVEILFIAVTPPRGDVLAHRIRECGFLGLIVPVGGAIDMVTGNRPRAPKKVQQLGLEWLYRLLQEPGRLWRRYVVECIPIMAILTSIMVSRRQLRLSQVVAQTLRWKK